MRALLPMLTVALLCACGAEPPEQRLADARAQLDAARSEVNALEDRVESKRETVRRAEKALETARTELDRAEQDLAAARERIDERATQVALFRAVQRALLESDALEGYAVRVQVQGDRVTLHGAVDTSWQEEKAREIARAQAGVERVESEIRVRDAEPGAQKRDAPQRSARS